MCSCGACAHACAFSVRPFLAPFFTALGPQLGSRLPVHARGSANARPIRICRFRSYVRESGTANHAHLVCAPACRPSCGGARVTHGPLRLQPPSSGLLDEKEDGVLFL